MTTAELVQAVWHVVRDQNESYPEATAADAVEHARNVLALPGKGGIGSFEIEDYSEPDHPDLGFAAYVAVLSATDEEIAAAVAALTETPPEHTLPDEVREQIEARGLVVSQWKITGTVVVYRTPPEVDAAPDEIVEESGPMAVVDLDTAGRVIHADVYPSMSDIEDGADIWEWAA